MNLLQAPYNLTLQSCLSEFLSSGRDCFSLEMNQTRAQDQLSVRRSKEEWNTRVYAIHTRQGCSCQVEMEKQVTCLHSAPNKL